MYNSFHPSLCSGAFSLCAGILQTVYPSLPSPSSLYPPGTPPDFPGTFKVRGMASDPVVISGAVAGVSLFEASVQPGSPFGSIPAPSYGAAFPTFGAANPSSETPLFQLPPLSSRGSHSGFNMLQMAPLGMVQPAAVGESSQIGFNMNPTRVGVGLSEPFVSRAGMVQPNFFGGGHHLGGSTLQPGVGDPLQPQLRSSSGATVNKNNNPFLF